MNVALRVKCEICEAKQGDPCTTIDLVPLPMTHIERLEDYKNAVTYDDSIWQIHGDRYEDIGYPDGTQFIGCPHWMERTLIRVVCLIDGSDDNLPPNLIRSEHLYWVDWAPQAITPLDTPTF